MNRILPIEVRPDSRSSSSPDVWNALRTVFTGRACHFGDFLFWKSAFALLRFYADFKEWSCFDWGELVLTFCHCWRWPLVDMVFNLWFHTSTHLRTDTPNCHQAASVTGSFLGSSHQQCSRCILCSFGCPRAFESSPRAESNGAWIGTDRFNGWIWMEREREKRYYAILKFRMKWYHDMPDGWGKWDGWLMHGDRSKNCTCCKF